MTLLPIVERELRVAARKWSTYWSRLTLPLILLVVFGVALHANPDAQPREMGRGLFLAAAWFCFVYCALGGVRATSDCVSREKREGTLGLLFLTDLKGHDVILGKLLAASVNTLSALAGVLPVLCIPLLLGGVSALAFAKVAATLTVTLLLALSLATLFSTLAKQERTGAGLTFLAMVLLCGITGMAYAILSDTYASDAPWWVDYVRLINPGFTCHYACQEAGLKSQTTADWLRSWLLQVVMLTAALVLASKLAPRVWQERTSGPHSWLRRGLDWCRFGPRLLRFNLRRRWLEVNPVTWLGLRHWFNLYSGWVFVGIVVTAWILLRVHLGRDAYSLEAATWIILVLFIGPKLAMTGEAGLVFSRDIRSGAMELILTTPLRIEEIVHGQLRALRCQFVPPALAGAGFSLVLLLLALLFGDVPPGDQGMTVATFLAGLMVFAADLYTLAWAGMWAGISAKNRNAAASETMAKVLFIPWFLVYFTMAALSVINYFLRRDWHPEGWLFLGIWFVGSLLNDLFWWRWSRQRLLTQFRRLALQRYDPARQHQFWITLGRTLRRWLG